MGLMRTTRIGATGIVYAAGTRMAATTRTAAARVAGTSTRTSTAACTRVSTDRIVAGVRVATSTRGGVVGVQVQTKGVELRSTRVTRRQEVGPRTR